MNKQLEKRMVKNQQTIKAKLKELEGLYKVIDQRTIALTKTMIKFSEEIKK